MSSTNPIKVYAYTTLDELKNAPFFSEIMTIPQITMSRGMSRSIGKAIRSLFGNVTDFTTFVDELFSGWSNRGNRFIYSTMINRYIRERIAKDVNNEEREWLFGCKKNIGAAVSNIIRLEEAGVTPQDFAKIIILQDRDIQLFLEFWKMLESGTENMREFRKVRKEYRNPEQFNKALNHEIEGISPNLKFRGQKKIVFNGFQYFSPMQQYIFDCFKNAGYEIIILIQAEKKYPYANEVWRQMYTEEKGFVPYEQWVFQDSDYVNPLGEIFEHGEKTKAHNIRLIKYKNTIEFMADIPRITNKENGFKLYCTDDRAANKMLKDYFPESYGERNLLAYPIGQFIYTMHQMWDENIQCITLNADGLRKCFASGWLSVNGKSSINYTEDLERLLPYFEGCYTVEEWRERLKIFNEAYNEAVWEFVLEPTGDSVADRKKEILGNPFKNFSPFSIKDERLEAVFGVLKQLMEMAEKLFGANEPVSIHNHMAKLDALLEMKQGMSEELYVQERSCIKQIFDALESDKVKDFLCYPGDIAYSMLNLMRGNMDDEDKVNNDLNILVFNIFHIEAATVFAKGKVHICLADIGKLPGPNGKFAWPMDSDILEQLEEPTNYVSNWINSNKVTTLSNRNYIYCALKNKEVEISWIQQQGEKLLSPSPYITLLDKLTNVKIEESNVRGLDQEEITSIPAQKKLERKDFSMRTNENLHIIDGEMEYALCPMRYVYSYVLGDNPTYRGDYQQNRAMMRFIQVLAKRLKPKYSIDQVAEQVFELFPGVRKAEKRQILDDAIQYPLPTQETEYTKFEDKEYTDLRLLLTFPDRDVYKSAEREFSMLMSQNGRKGVFFAKTGEERERNCELCPHSGYCRESWFGQDYQAEGND
ncbi:MAG: hypothetical protein IJ353_06965 [Lachnospiraceae bacterium]|nr:hypothetical protein [Lachnospiraceae bacterium]